MSALTDAQVEAVIARYEFRRDSGSSTREEKDLAVETIRLLRELLALRRKKGGARQPSALSPQLSAVSCRPAHRRPWKDEALAKGVVIPVEGTVR